VPIQICLTGHHHHHTTHERIGGQTTTLTLTDLNGTAHKETLNETAVDKTTTQIANHLDIAAIAVIEVTEATEGDPVSILQKLNAVIDPTMVDVAEMMTVEETMIETLMIDETIEMTVEAEAAIILTETTDMVEETEMIDMVDMMNDETEMVEMEDDTMTTTGIVDVVAEEVTKIGKGTLRNCSWHMPFHSSKRKAPNMQENGFPNEVVVVVVFNLIYENMAFMVERFMMHFPLLFMSFS